MQILIRDFNVNEIREDIFKPTKRNEDFYEISNDNGFTALHFAKSNNLIAKSTMCPHCNIHKYTSTSADGTGDRKKFLEISSFSAVRP
jgi:hypothetical protein